MCLISLLRADEYPSIVINDDDVINLNGSKWSPEGRRAEYYTDVKNLFTCPGPGSCVPMVDCGENYALEAARRCYNGDKHVFCGVDARGEPMVCCDRTRKNFEACGKTLVQGRTYKGLGAYPFVVRIGFKNTHSGNMAYPCTGSILSRTTILTAAHCALAKSEGYKM